MRKQYNLKESDLTKGIRCQILSYPNWKSCMGMREHLSFVISQYNSQLSCKHLYIATPAEVGRYLVTVVSWQQFSRVHCTGRPCIFYLYLNKYLVYDDLWTTYVSPRVWPASVFREWLTTSKHLLQPRSLDQKFVDMPCK